MDFACKVDGLTHEGKPLSGNWPFACDCCPAIFKGNYELAQHRRKHTDERTYACTDCDKTFKYNSSLNKHRKRHHCRPDDMFTCDICNKRFRLRQSLSAHYKLHAGKNKYRKWSLPASIGYPELAGRVRGEGCSCSIFNTNLTKAKLYLLRQSMEKIVLASLIPNTFDFLTGASEPDFLFVYLSDVSYSISKLHILCVR